ncbi:putative phosphodiesterase I [Helianthus annuus]|nr:putative phosphodiesterase I [Helianthus annuus]
MTNSDHPLQINTKRPKFTVNCTASIHINTFGTPLISKTTGSPTDLIRLEPNKPCTIGRDPRRCEFVYDHKQVSKQHCQIYFDANNKKVCVVDGVMCFTSSARVSLNGVFVDGVRVGNGEVKELCAGSEVSVFCGNDGGCRGGGRLGFVIERIVYTEEVVDKFDKFRSVSRNVVGELGGSKVVDSYDKFCSFSRNVVGELGGGKVVDAGLVLSKCREILSSDDPVLCLRECDINACELRAKCGSRNRLKSNSCFTSGEFSSRSALKLRSREGLAVNDDNNTLHTSYAHNCIDLESNAEVLCCSVNDGRLQQPVNAGVRIGNSVSNDKRSETYTCEEKFIQSDERLKPKNKAVSVPPPGNKFYLNRLHFMGDDQSDEVTVTLPELLYPVETLKQVFIATFTSDLSWFLSYCEIPAHLPISIACHNAERCWSSSPDKRISRPYADFPNLVVIYPQFPEVISFGKEKKKFGIACHHPKLFVLQRDDSIRVIITSANLVSKQWLRVTNTVWWQDFPRANVSDYVSLFAKSSTDEVNLDSKSDFAAQLAGFMAALLVGVPDQAHWILELTKFDFSNASGHLLASVPGIYSPKHPYISESHHYLTGHPCTSQPLKRMLLGSVEASVVGISHLFRTSADSNGALLKRLARAIGKCHISTYGLLEVVLRRNLSIAADANAISVAISDTQELPDGGCIQVGFLPRDVAKWVAPLSDSGLFAFSAYIYPKEVLACALEGSNNKAHLILYVYQGPNFVNISKLVSPAVASAMCSLVASVQRCSGLWRLHEILGHYKWPEQWETDFTFGSSSVGAVNAPFLAAFSAATGKRSLQLSESEESDPDWGCWSASQELRNPSIRIIFPTIERVKTASCGIWASKYILCFSQKTWLRLKHLGILHDAVPHPIDRIGHPMHVKVARRRFQSRTDTSSFGWVYCGSHNFSAAAWGRPIHSSGMNLNEDSRTKSVLGSRLHICNYEFGIVFVVPPSENKHYADKSHSNLDDITLPFVIPAPRYRHMDTPATKFAMSNLARQEREKNVEPADVEEEIPDEEEEVLEVPDVIIEKEDDKAYAEKLWGLS